MTHPFQEHPNDNTHKQSPRSPTRRRSGEDSSEKKKSSEEMLSQESRGAAVAGMSSYSPPGVASRPHTFVAPRSDDIQEEFDVPRHGEAWAYVPEKATERTTTVEQEPTAEEFASWSRSERKRFREKKRRGEVNKGFDELMALLLQVE